MTILAFIACHEILRLVVTGVKTKLNCIAEYWKLCIQFWVRKAFSVSHEELLDLRRGKLDDATFKTLMGIWNEKIGLKETLLCERTFEVIKIVFTAVAYLRGWLHGEFQPGLKKKPRLHGKFQPGLYTRVLRMRLRICSPGGDFLSITWGISAQSNGLKISSRVAQTGLKFQPGSPGWNFLYVIANSVLQGFYRKPGMNFQPGQPAWKSSCNQPLTSVLRYLDCLIWIQKLINNLWR